MKTPDYYSILGIDRNASGNEIKTAYRRLAQRFHPDVTDDPNGESQFKAVAQAYRTLKRAETRTAYDRLTLPINGVDEFTWFVTPLLFWCALCQLAAWPGLWPK